MARDPTVKQRIFVEALCGPAEGNRTVAARMAHYKGSNAVLSVQGSRNMKNAKIRQLIDEKYREMVKTSVEVNVQALSATTRKAFLTKQGVVTYSAPEPNWKVRMDAASRVLQHFEQPSPDEVNGKGDGEPKNENPELLDAPPPAAAGEANLYAEMSETDRQFTRLWLEKGLAAQRLQEQIREQQSQPATGEAAGS
jgi:phage terminase small subunit